MQRTALLAALILALLPLSLSAQRVTRRVYVSAVDAGGAPVLNLTANDFRLTENDRKREVTRVSLGSTPMRIVLMVDSSTAMGPMMSTFRIALTAFTDAVPPEHEITFITTGGQIRVRTQPGTDRTKLKQEIGLLASAGGANAFLDTLLESDRRFLKTAKPGQWPVLVIVTTDNGGNSREFNIADYNKFMNDFLARGGMAHAVIVRGREIGPVTDITQNLIENVGGLYNAINTDTSLADHLKDIAQRLAEDHLKMSDAYEVEFLGDAQQLKPTVQVTTTREGVELQMSPRRPFDPSRQ